MRWSRSTEHMVGNINGLYLVTRIDGLVQDCSNASALAMALLQACIKLLICAHKFPWFEQCVSKELLQSCGKPLKHALKFPWFEKKKKFTFNIFRNKLLSFYYIDSNIFWNLWSITSCAIFDWSQMALLSITIMSSWSTWIWQNKGKVQIMDDWMDGWVDWWIGWDGWMHEWVDSYLGPSQYTDTILPE